VADEESAALREEGTSAATDVSVWWVYLLGCEDGRTYGGVALDIKKRFDLHVAGKAAKFTRANRPVMILGAQPFPDKSAALKGEHALKQLSRTERLLWAREHPFPN